MIKMNMKNEWMPIVPAPHFKFEVAGDSIEGVLISASESKESEYNTKVYVVENKGGQHTIFGSEVIDSRLRGIEVGTMIKIVFKGQKQSQQSKFKYYDFEVFRKAKEA